MLDRKEIIKILYPVISTLFAIIIGVVLFFVGSYLTKAINSAIGSIPTELSITSSIDLRTYDEAARRLNLNPVSAVPEIGTPISTSAEVPATPITEPAPQFAKIKPEDLSVTILNGAGIAGLAAQYKVVLTHELYNVTRLGNEIKLNKETIIKIKASKQSALADLEKILGKTLVMAPSEILPETNSEDIVIIIGSSNK